ncbi:unnamed protein product [Moneuplotes crassus]|uniref:Uncharacterized protein n=1 Tax=Euplotes crassus TaxID=5936 RepID=A0AAD1Y7A1_EUPCR|nr:unnamed protein product [Moneuplotes crassus]
MDRHSIQMNSERKPNSELDANNQDSNLEQDQDNNFIYQDKEGDAHPSHHNKQILDMSHSPGLGFEVQRVQLAEEHFLDCDTEKDAKIEFCSPSTLNNDLSENQESIIGGDRGGSSILRQTQNVEKPQSVIMPRKLDLRIHTNINDNFEILSSQNSSIISRLVAGVEDSHAINEEDTRNNLLEATGETCIIFDNAQAQTENLDAGSEDENQECSEKAELGQTLSSHFLENTSDENTMIIHNNVPSGESLSEFEEELKQSEESANSGENFKRESKISIINDPTLKDHEFQRIELNSTLKQSQTILEDSDPYQHCEIGEMQSPSQNSAQQEQMNVFKRKKSKKSSTGSYSDTSETQKDNNSCSALDKSDVLKTPKERDIAPKAFKRTRKDFSNKSHNSSKDKTVDMLKYKKENSKLQREIEKIKKAHVEEIERITKDFDDRLAHSLNEKEKEYALILDSQLMEREDQILETENRLNKEYSDRVDQYQTIIQNLKKENQDLQEENQDQQNKLDENSKLIQSLRQELEKQTLKVKELQCQKGTPVSLYKQIKPPIVTENTPQGLKRETNAVNSFPRSISSNGKENMTENTLDKKRPIDNLKGYWKKMKSRRSSKTRRSRYLNNAQNNRSQSYSNPPSGCQSTVKRPNTEYKGYKESPIGCKENDKSGNKNDLVPTNQKACDMNENLSLSPKFVIDVKEERFNNDSGNINFSPRDNGEEVALKAKLTSLEESSSKKNKLINDPYNTVECPDSMKKEGLIGRKPDVQNQASVKDIDWNENIDDTFDDDSADIEDSMFLDEVAVSQKEINTSFINIKRNQPMEYKMKKILS